LSCRRSRSRPTSWYPSRKADNRRFVVFENEPAGDKYFTRFRKVNATTGSSPSGQARPIFALPSASLVQFLGSTPNSVSSSQGSGHLPRCRDRIPGNNRPLVPRTGSHRTSRHRCREINSPSPRRVTELRARWTGHRARHSNRRVRVHWSALRHPGGRQCRRTGYRRCRFGRHARCTARRHCRGSSGAAASPEFRRFVWSQ